ncbi:Bax inhibitor-1/YccA family protein [Brachybacterium halotolerans subsp. kimchii]|uniref:Bax inhibitor-1/YccA family protein n=1 Tax=Brachybacterium halotolerans TaxID=2795215 RepID=UPI001E41B180|nr:Bax inhibitor-1/YccA family protein [Brachybacterium halotolerans]UEJ82158.1 Bax inhibitor-1/YccA family protein [Brachybacterium halotolerans subsp. kimchii]
MAHHNIVFGKDKALAQGQGQYAASPDFRSDFPATGQGTQQTQQAPGQQAPDLESLYARPAATGHDTGRMTMRDALNAITATLGVTIVFGVVFCLLPVALGVVGGTEGEKLGYGIAIGAMVVGFLGGFVLAMVNSFKKRPSAVLVLAYAALEGAALGGFSAMMERVYPGIALQAVLGTLAVATTVLVLFRIGVLRTSPVLTKIFAVAMVAYLLFCLVNIGLMLVTGTDLRSGLLGLVIGALAVVMAAYSLVMDFEDVQRGVRAGVDRSYAWRCAFGITVTLVWMYIEILRILSILRNN